ncbi:Predicted Fe-Mo cluster-binding protein, NifX family [Desulfacinum hydrothermale DSM 13146]|uniref:Predicted Fe-Mo cluster-binding protein, NifX family n=1 Tax=Desulfacinum hydrothermale DSM 13146 TaxID=1121390 RepID=A0A1W1XJI5_9BACT|nr:NifB/NifX family molybdenum-iron cluster-binding protein [Desulfacinum hydrothermale]SMC23982.1 Predicted Fe-Mo cluster-binding protein, NifX family [Desulfacinum hydrothermale DSM 13146]
MICSTPSPEHGFLRVAIPSFGPNVAPHFSTAQEILIYVVHKGRVRIRIPLSVAQEPPPQKLRKVLALGIQVLVCGGIEERTRAVLERRGVRVLSNRTGPVADILNRMAAATEPTGPPIANS